MHENNFAPLRLKTELPPAEFLQFSCNGVVSARWCVKHQEAAAAGAQQLAANRARLARSRVPAVDGAGAHGVSEAALELPVLMNDFAEGIEIVLLQFRLQVA